MATERGALAGPKTLRSPKVSELVAADIRRQIIAGQLRSGERLPSEAQMMQSYEIARPTLREALRLLENDQLLTVRRGSHLGWRVRLPDPSLAARSVTMLLELRGATLRDVYTARLVFEPPACRLAAEHATAAQVAGLRRTLAEELSVDDDRDAYPIVAWRFHSELADMSGNHTLAVLSAALQEISQSHAARMVASKWDRTVWERSYRSHERVVDLIEAGRGKDAESFWRRHMEAAGEQLLSDLGDVPVSEIV